jgi:spore germination protein KB
MSKMNISLIQLFCLIILFELGSAILIGVGIEANQDAWLAIMIAMIFGVVLFIMYSYLYQLYPSEPFTLFVNKIVGKYAGNTLTILYIFYFIYLAARVLRDFTDSIEIHLLAGTPDFIISLLMTAVITYGVFLGIEVIARTGEILFALAISSGFILLILVYVSGEIQFENLQPVLDHGIGKVIQSTFPTLPTFPFGEMVVFLMFLHYVNPSLKKKAIKTSITGIIISGVILSFTMLTNIVVLGPYIVKESDFPLLETLGRVNIGGFIQRLDSFAILFLIIGGFFKIILFFAASCIGMASLTKEKKVKGFILPLALLMIVLSMGMASNTVQHLKIGLQIVPVYLHLPLQVGIPFLLCLIAFLKNRVKKQESLEE